MRINPDAAGPSLDINDQFLLMERLRARLNALGRETYWASADVNDRAHWVRVVIIDNIGWFGDNEDCIEEQVKDDIKSHYKGTGIVFKGMCGVPESREVPR